MKNLRELFLVIEGIDGAGKTTCAKILAEKLNAYYYKTPPGIFEKIRPEIEIFSDPLTRFSFYLASVFYASIEISKIIAWRPVVCDHYLLSTIAYHRAIGLNLSWVNFSQLPIILPNINFYLHADENTYLERLKKRYPVIDSALEKNREFQRKVHEEFFRLNVVPIDTTSLSINEVVEQLLSKIP